MRVSEREALLPNSACCKCLCLWLPCGVWLNWYTRRQQHELAPHTQPGVNEDGAPATAPPAAHIPASAAQHTYSRAKDIAKRTFDGTWYAVPRGMVYTEVSGAADNACSVHTEAQRLTCKRCSRKSPGDQDGREAVMLPSMAATATWKDAVLATLIEHGIQDVESLREALQAKNHEQKPLPRDVIRKCVALRTSAPVCHSSGPAFLPVPVALCLCRHLWLTLSLCMCVLRACMSVCVRSYAYSHRDVERGYALLVWGDQCERRCADSCSFHVGRFLGDTVAHCNKEQCPDKLGRKAGTR